MQKWLEHISKAVFAAEQLKMALPEWYEEFVHKPGRQRYYEDYQYASLRNEIDSLYGDMAF
ncbi:MAG: hypothetical protein E7521_08575 [Ruminococcaceae bacterium]|nr:hypothetical protein [Oscillospiraceae bacterium]